MQKPDRSDFQNRLLARLSDEDFERLRPGLVKTRLAFQQQLERAHRHIDHVYFPESGIASVVITDADWRSVEIALIGREGCTGLPGILGAGQAPHETYMQLAGDAWRIRTADLADAIGESRTLLKTFLLYSHCFYVQTSQTALANARSKLEDRLVRWLLMTHDRAGADEFAVTHELLSVMLGVRRPGVTVALNALQRRGLIHLERGLLVIIDRDGMIASANGDYGVAEAEYDRVMAA